MLRTSDGERVYDAPDVEALLAMAWLDAFVQLGMLRVDELVNGATTSASAHRLETGHRLGFGCCRATSADVARAA